ncbi:MAG: RagB/SusD family nutrient uptake outer membrane protein [Flavobacteriales bacterium]|nr:MAG: RagB/SusD family nutrient uptake outer membrane protein [Flavobacteriales bacterium]
MKKNIQITILSALLLILISGCKKFLEEKSDKRLSIPTTAEDFQAMLNSYGNLNVDFIAAGEVSSDDYYLTDADFSSLYYESDKRQYTWQPDYVARPLSSSGDEWSNCYKPIYVCNSVLKGLEDNNLHGTKADNVKGQALVFRAARYLDGVQTWAPAYNKKTANIDLGMVLRLDPDMNLPSERSTVQQTYDLIIDDLNKAITLLPTVQSGATLPAKDVAYGLLARTYLFMAEYEKALQNAEAAVGNTKAQLVDFNLLDANADFPIPALNNVSQEMMLWSVILYTDQLDQSIAKITPALYNMYDNGDLRKVIYFGKNTDDTYFFKGSQLGTSGLVNCITISEILLIISECNARLGNLPKAAEALNQIMVKRWEEGNFTPYTFTNNEVALREILEERRKELVMRGLRWADIKRLNRDGYNITLTRTNNGQTHTLYPNDLRYAIAIPETVIEIGGIQQNPR